MTEVAERIWNDEIYETIERLNAPIPDVMPDKGSAENDVAAGVETAEDVIEAPDSADAAFQTDATDETLAGTKHSPSTALAVLDTVMPLGMGPSQKEPIEFHDDGRPIIKVQQGYLRDAMGLAETCLAQSGRYFQRAGAIVEVRVDPATRETAVHDLNPMALVHALAGVSAWKRLDRRSNSRELVDPIERICKVMIKAGSFSVLPVLNGLARQPYLRPDGSVCQTAGHDPATGIRHIRTVTCESNSMGNPPLDKPRSTLFNVGVLRSPPSNKTSKTRSLSSPAPAVGSAKRPPDC